MDGLEPGIAGEAPGMASDMEGELRLAPPRASATLPALLVPGALVAGIGCGLALFVLNQLPFHIMAFPEVGVGVVVAFTVALLGPARHPYANPFVLIAVSVLACLTAVLMQQYANYWNDTRVDAGAFQLSHFPEYVLIRAHHLEVGEFKGRVGIFLLWGIGLAISLTVAVTMVLAALGLCRRIGAPLAVARFIAAAQARRLPEARIREALARGGWEDADQMRAFRAAALLVEERDSPHWWIRWLASV